MILKCTAVAKFLLSKVKISYASITVVKRNDFDCFFLFFFKYTCYVFYSDNALYSFCRNSEH